MDYFYTIYRITNLVNNKIYIGKHKTKNLDDGYYGSGIYLRKAIRKYGKSNFLKETLFVFDNELDMNFKEKEIVTEDFISSATNYNARSGGTGGFTKEESLRGTRALLEKYTSEERTKQSKEHYHKTGIANLTTEQRSEIAKLYWKKYREETRSGKRKSRAPLSEERKQHLSSLLKGRKNTNYPKTRANRTPFEYKTVSCPHCFTEGKSNAMGRWHFDKCKVLKNFLF